MLLIRSDIARRGLEELKNTYLINGDGIEVLVLELILKGSKWLFSSVYKQLKVTDMQCSVFLENHFSACEKVCSNLVPTDNINLH